MKKVILLAGFPATGKTYMSGIIKDQYNEAMYISQDEFKELLYDKIGFDNLTQKDEVVELSRLMFYKAVNKSLEFNNILILDYPFSYKQIPFLDSLKKKFECSINTIRLVGDLDVLYDRRVERDLVKSRNKGHILAKYHGYESYDRDNYPLSRTEYKMNCKNGKYDEFTYGDTLEIDVTDYDLIDYKIIRTFIKNKLEGEKND